MPSLFGMDLSIFLVHLQLIILSERLQVLAGTKPCPIRLRSIPANLQTSKHRFHPQLTKALCTSSICDFRCRQQRNTITAKRLARSKHKGLWSRWTRPYHNKGKARNHGMSYIGHTHETRDLSNKFIICLPQRSLLELS